MISDEEDNKESKSPEAAAVQSSGSSECEEGELSTSGDDAELSSHESSPEPG